MGLFDYLRCEHPLPDGFEGDLQYQTKDTPAQYLEDYRITLDGTLMYEPSGMLKTPAGPIDFHGALEFYATNVCGTAQWGVITDDDDPPFSREYVALYDHGTLLKIEGGLVADAFADSAHLSRDEWHAKSREKEDPDPTPRDPAAPGGDDG